MRSKYLKTVVAALLSLTLGCSQLPLSSDSQFEILRASQSVFKKKDPSHLDDFSYAPLRNKKVESYVSSVGKRLFTSSKNVIDFHILATPYIQGFTDYSGPEVYVTLGMLNTISNEAELAALLGHEIGHVELKHGESEFKDKGRLWDIITHEAENQSGLSVGLSDHRYDIAYANFEKNKEEKADEFGAELAAKGGYNPYAFCDLFERLAKNVKDEVFVQIGNLKGSHKSLKARSQHLRSYLAKKGYPDTREGLFSYQYQMALSSLTSPQKQPALTREEQKILTEVASFQKEVEQHQKSKKPLSANRFTHIMSRILDLADAYNLSKESLLLDSKPYKTFMQERLIQRDPLWGGFESRLNVQLTFLVASMAYCKIGLTGSAAPITAEGVIGSSLSAPTAFVGSSAALGYALHKATEPPEKAADPKEEQTKPVFEPNPKHGPFPKGRANSEPTHPQETLDNSVRVSENSPRRVGADKATGEFDVFDEHTPGKFHGHSRTWGELTEAMKSSLRKAKITNSKGKIL